MASTDASAAQGGNVEDLRVVVAVDLDEVLGHFVAALAVWHNKVHETQHNEADYNSYHFADVWGCDDAESASRVWTFFESEDFATLQPIEGAAVALRGLSKTHKFVVVTSRQLAIEEATLAWLNKHFDGVFDQVLLANHYAKEGSGPVKTKLELCQSVGAVALIDDSLKYVTQCAGHLGSVILFGDYAWNCRGEAEVALPQGALRAHNWTQLRGMLTRMGRTGVIRPQDSVVCTLKHKAEFYANSVRWLLENQESANVTAVGTSIATLVRAQTSLMRAGDVTVESLRTGVDAPVKRLQRLPRLTVTLRRTPALLSKLLVVCNESCRFKAARAGIEAARHKAVDLAAGGTAAVLGNMPGGILPPARPLYGGATRGLPAQLAGQAQAAAAEGGAVRGRGR